MALKPEEARLRVRFLQLEAELKGKIPELVEAAVEQKMEEMLPAFIKERYQIFGDVLFSVSQVAEMTKHSPDAIYKMIQRNQIPYIKNGTSISIKFEDIPKHLLFGKRDKQ